MLFSRVYGKCQIDYVETDDGIRDFSVEHFLNL